MQALTLQQAVHLLVFVFVQAKFAFTQISSPHLPKAGMFLCYRVSFEVSAKFTCFVQLKFIDTFRRIFALQLSDFTGTLGSLLDQGRLSCELSQWQSEFVGNFLRVSIEFL